MLPHAIGSPTDYTKPGSTRSIDGIGNVFGRSRMRDAAAARRLAQRDPALWRLARRRARRHLRDRARPRLRRRPRLAPGSASRSSPGPTRKGITATCSAAAPLSGGSAKTRSTGYQSRDGGKPLRDALAEAGFAGRPRDAGRSRRAISAISKPISSRATRSTRRGSAASASSRPSSASGISASRFTGAAEPRRHDADGAAQGCRRRDGAARDADPRPLCRNRRAAHGVDDRPHAVRPERALGRPRPCRNAGAVPRRRPGVSRRLRANA